MKNGNSKNQLTFWSGEHPVKHSASLESAKDSTIQEADSPSHTLRWPTTSTPNGLSGRTCQESSPLKTTPSVAFWEACREKNVSSSRQGKGGRTLVVCMDPKGQSHGDASMPNTSAWPNDASVCLLSHVLQTKEIPPHFYLSLKGCEGILRRAEKRGKQLPPSLRDALEAVVKGELPVVGAST